MSTLDQVNPDALFTMFKGEPGTRKSTCALSYPMPQYWISTDRKMNALQLPALKWGINMKQIEFDDYTNWDAPKQRLELLETNCKFKTVIVDSITSIGDAMNRQVTKTKGKDAYHIGGIPVDTIEDYKAEASAFRELIALLNSIRKYHKIQVIIIAHVVGQRSNNDANKLTHHSRVIVTGGDKISAKISSYMDEAYHFNIKPGQVESQVGQYSLLTAHTGNDYARTSLELPREIIFGDKPLYNDWVKPAIDKMKAQMAAIKAAEVKPASNVESFVTPTIQPEKESNMPLVEFSKRDLLRGKPIDPSWYRVNLDEIDAEGKLSKDKGSTNYNVEATVLFDGDNGDTKFAGYPIVWNFNSKAMGFSKGLFESLGLELKPGERYRLEACQGREVDVYIENSPWEGRIINKVNHKYRPIKSEVVAGPNSAEGEVVPETE